MEPLERPVDGLARMGVHLPAQPGKDPARSRFCSQVQIELPAPGTSHGGGASLLAVLSTMP
jgi:hypothetical protein